MPPYDELALPALSSKGKRIVAHTRMLTQKLSIRLLRRGINPEDSLRKRLRIRDWPRIDGARISLGTTVRHSPAWADFLALTSDEKTQLRSNLSYGLVFIPIQNRWFCVAFGMGHLKLEPSSLEQNFGLRVVLNEIDPTQLRSMDIRTPDSNTLVRRSQTSRGSDQHIFNVDIDTDLVRVLAGKPKVTTFALRLAGADALTIHRRVLVDDLPTVCAEALEISKKTRYKEHFGWIDHIRHIRDGGLIGRLDSTVVAAFERALEGSIDPNLHLAFPNVYDPEHTKRLRYRGFRSQESYADLDLAGYLDALKKRGVTGYRLMNLKTHTVCEVDDHGSNWGGKWRIGECVGFEVEMDGSTHVVSGGKWYQVDNDVASQARRAFEKLGRVEMPPAMVGESEPEYNDRIGRPGTGFLCLDRKLIKPPNATTRIEVCDLVDRNGRLVHVKNKSASSRLSHLFEQGTVSGRVLKIDDESRDMVRNRITEVEQLVGKRGYEDVLPSSKESFRPEEFKVVYAVIAGEHERRLPFFSLVALRRATRELRGLGYECAFAWIGRPSG